MSSRVVTSVLSSLNTSKGRSGRREPPPPPQEQHRSAATRAGTVRRSYWTRHTVVGDDGSPQPSQSPSPPHPSHGVANATATPTSRPPIVATGYNTAAARPPAAPFTQDAGASRVSGGGVQTPRRQATRTPAYIASPSSLPRTDLSGVSVPTPSSRRRLAANASDRSAVLPVATPASAAGVRSVQRSGASTSRRANTSTRTTSPRKRRSSRSPRAARKASAKSPRRKKSQSPRAAGRRSAGTSAAATGSVPPALASLSRADAHHPQHGGVGSYTGAQPASASMVHTEQHLFDHSAVSASGSHVHGHEHSSVLGSSGHHHHRRCTKCVEIAHQVSLVSVPWDLRPWLTCCVHYSVSNGHWSWQTEH